MTNRRAGCAQRCKSGSEGGSWKGAAHAAPRWLPTLLYMAQQIQQFRQRGQEFAMQHLGTDDEMMRAWREVLRSLTPEDRREVLAGMSVEEMLESLTPEELERLRQLLRDRTKSDDSSQK